KGAAADLTVHTGRESHDAQERGHPCQSDESRSSHTYLLRSCGTEIDRRVNQGTTCCHESEGPGCGSVERNDQQCGASYSDERASRGSGGPSCFAGAASYKRRTAISRRRRRAYV